MRLSRARTLHYLRVLREMCHLIRDRERKASKAPASYTGTDARVLSAAQFVLVVWMQYARRKQALVRSTDWCSRRIRHKDWLLASDSEVGIALATGTTLQATTTGDALWVERHLAETLGVLLGGREVPDLASTLGGLDDPLRELVSRGMFEESRLWMDSVVSLARTATITATSEPPAAGTREGSVRAASASAHAEAPHSEGHLHNLVDTIAIAYTQAVLGLHDYAYQLATDFQDWVVAQAYGANVRNVGPLPAELLKNLSDGLKFEKAVERHRITSDANIKQLVARAVATETIDEATALLATFEDEFWPWASSFVGSEVFAAGVALSRLDEALRKWDSTLAALSGLFNECEAVHRDVDDTWPDLNLDRLEARRAAMQQRLRSPIATVAARVDVDMNPDRPDMFGWAFYRAHHDLLEDVLSGQSPTGSDLEERLLGLVSATDRAGKRLRTTVRRQHDSVLGALWSEPMLMLLQLSGAALVTALARQRTDLRDAFVRVWGALLDVNAQGVLDLTLTALAMDEALFALSPGKLKRANCHQQVMAALESEGMGMPHHDYDLGGGDLDESDSNLSGRLAVMLSHVAYGDFEALFVAAWVVPEAQRRGAVLPADGLGRQLAGLIAALRDATDEEQTTMPDESYSAAARHDGEGT